MGSKNWNLSIMHKLTIIMLMMSMIMIGLFASQIFTIRQNYEVAKKIEEVNSLTKKLLYVDMEEKNYISLQEDLYLKNAENYLEQVEKDYIELESRMFKVNEFQQMKEVIHQYKNYHSEIRQNHQVLEDSLLNLNVQSANSLAVIHKLMDQIELQKEALQKNDNRDEFYQKEEELAMAHKIVYQFQELNILQLDYLNRGQAYDILVVIREGEYFGIVSIHSLLKTLIRVESQYAKELNPLTNLPGNSIINRVLNDLIVYKEEACVVYLDVDQFKPFNDIHVRNLWSN